MYTECTVLINICSLILILLPLYLFKSVLSDDVGDDITTVLLQFALTLFASTLAAIHQWIVTGSTTAIACQHLLVKDDDTLPENIVYTLHSRPNNGVIFAGDAELNSTDSFSQDDINNQLVVFQHQGLTFDYSSTRNCQVISHWVGC